MRLWVGAFLFFIAGTAALQPSMRVLAESPPPDREQVEQIIHDHLLKHPELVIEALQTAEAKQKQKEQEATRAALASRQDELLNDPAAPPAAIRKAM